MTPHHGEPPGDPSGPGENTRAGWPRRTLVWLPLALVAAVALAYVTVTDRGGESAVRQPPPESHSAVRDSEPSTPAGGSALVRSWTVGHPVLGVHAQWELIVRGTGEIFRIELARGRITRTVIPSLRSTGPVNLLVGPERAVVRPLDHVQAYVVPDGKPAREVGGELDSGGRYFPGPEPGQVWAVREDSGEASVLELVGMDGHPAGRTITLPAAGFRAISGDARGHVLVSGTGGTYLALPDGLRRITSGAVLAVGRHHFLTLTCDKRARCSRVLIDRSTGEHAVLGSATGGESMRVGMISPDGTVAAVFRRAMSGSSVHLLDLASGTEKELYLPIYYGGDKLAISPDGRWLFIVSRGQLHAFDTKAMRLRELGVDLPSVSQVAVRAAPA